MDKFFDGIKFYILKEHFMATNVNINIKTF